MIDLDDPAKGLIESFIVPKVTICHPSWRKLMFTGQGRPDVMLSHLYSWMNQFKYDMHPITNNLFSMNASNSVETFESNLSVYMKESYVNHITTCHVSFGFFRYDFLMAGVYGTMLYLERKGISHYKIIFHLYIEIGESLFSIQGILTFIDHALSEAYNQTCMHVERVLIKDILSMIQTSEQSISKINSVIRPIMVNHLDEFLKYGLLSGCIFKQPQLILSSIAIIHNLFILSMMEIKSKTSEWEFEYGNMCIEYITNEIDVFRDFCLKYNRGIAIYQHNAIDAYDTLRFNTRWGEGYFVENQYPFQIDE